MNNTNNIKTLLHFLREITLKERNAQADYINLLKSKESVEEKQALGPPPTKSILPQIEPFYFEETIKKVESGEIPHDQDVLPDMLKFKNILRDDQNKLILIESEGGEYVVMFSIFYAGTIMLNEATDLVKIKLISDEENEKKESVAETLIYEKEGFPKEIQMNQIYIDTATAVFLNDNNIVCKLSADRKDCFIECSLRKYSPDSDEYKEASMLWEETLKKVKHRFQYITKRFQNSMTNEYQKISKKINEEDKERYGFRQQQRRKDYEVGYVGFDVVLDQLKRCKQIFP